MKGPVRYNGGDCKHCAAPAGSHVCRFTWYLPYRAEYYNSGVEPPCFQDAMQAESDNDQREYLERMEATDRKTRRVIMWILVIFAILGLADVWRHS